MNSGQVGSPEFTPVAAAGESSPTARVERLIAQRTQYEGPLPPPALFKEFGLVVPTAPERILCQFEEDSKHFRKISSTAIESETGSVKRAQWMAFVLVLFCVTGAFVFARYGHETLAGILLVSTLVPIVANYLKSPNSVEPDKGELKEKIPRKQTGKRR